MLVGYRLPTSRDAVVEGVGTGTAVGVVLLDGVMVVFLNEDEEEVSPGAGVTPGCSSTATSSGDVSSRLS